MAGTRGADSSESTGWTLRRAVQLALRVSARQAALDGLVHSVGPFSYLAELSPRSSAADLSARLDRTLLDLDRVQRRDVDAVHEACIGLGLEWDRLMALGDAGLELAQLKALLAHPPYAVLVAAPRFEVTCDVALDLVARGLFGLTVELLLPGEDAVRQAFRQQDRQAAMAAARGLYRGTTRAYHWGDPLHPVEVHWDARDLPPASEDSTPFDPANLDSSAVAALLHAASTRRSRSAASLEMVRNGLASTALTLTCVAIQEALERLALWYTDDGPDRGDRGPGDEPPGDPPRDPSGPAVRPVERVERSAPAPGQRGATHRPLVPYPR